MSGTTYLLEVKPIIPGKLSELTCFANDLCYSWMPQIRNLFVALDKPLWEECGHNPQAFLRQIQQGKLDKAADNAAYLEKYHRVLDWYQQYHQQGMNKNLQPLLNPGEDLIAYFCAEFGFHESLPIYSGGLGILAGDHCKAASDLGIPFVAVGLLYHQGYITQTIDPDGQQISRNINLYFGHLPILLMKNGDGQEIHTSVQMQGRQVSLRIWKVKIGRVNLYLLDSDVKSNSDEDRQITRQLYGEGPDIRIKQEIILGIGGVRALRKVGLVPNIWHINEGHPAFQILERCAELVAEGMDFDSALELVAGSTVFTTHTPVAAGHDSFGQQTMVDYLRETAQRLGITFDKLLSLGAAPENSLRFNMTALALRGSRFHNAVSAIHGEVASTMEKHIWPEIPPDENPITSITNGVHVPSILAKKWKDLFDSSFPGWRDNLSNPDYWQCIDSIPDKIFWKTHHALKNAMLNEVCTRLQIQHLRNESSKAFQEATICHLTEESDRILILGFARRFATYKRATLVLSDLARLARIVNNPQRRVIIMFAGKAHPSDEPGRQLIRTIHQISERAEFVGKIILIEGYDLSLARRMTSGTDVWLNTPIHPLEACGTSGQKAAINGVLNLSMMDGWWAEGYNGHNGWAVEPHTDKFGPDYRNQQEASDLLDLLENTVIPAYFERDKDSIPPAWIKMSKASIKSTIARFSSQRMVEDYINKQYLPAKKQHLTLSGEQRKAVKSLAQWKQKVKACWPGCSFRVIDKPSVAINYGDYWSIRIEVYLNGLSPDDIVVEYLRGKKTQYEHFAVKNVYQFTVESGYNDQNKEVVYALNILPEVSGIFHYKIRMYPYHTLLSHRFEMGDMRWL